MTRSSDAADAEPLRRLSPLRDFLRTEPSGGVLLVVGALVALIWADSPWSASYRDLWQTTASVSVDGHVLTLDLRHVVNDGLMTIFFVVGLEIRRELANGHLSMLAFVDDALRAQAKLSVLAASIVAAVLALALLSGRPPKD